MFIDLIAIFLFFLAGFFSLMTGWSARKSHLSSRPDPELDGGIKILMIAYVICFTVATTLVVA